MRARQRNQLVPRIVVAGFALAAAVMALASGCDPRTTAVLDRIRRGAETRAVAKHEVLPTRDSDHLRIATFNLKVFGISKLADAAARGILADIMRQFDVVAVQEIRSADQSVLAQLVQSVNAASGESSYGQYDFILGPRLGRTDSKEQYAFVFDRSRVDVDRYNVYTLVDERDLLHREPFVARFVAQQQGADPFTFTLVNIHTDPDVAAQEVDVLPEVLRVVRQDGSAEDDVILLGDFNAGPSRFGRLSQVPDLHWVVNTEATDTSGTQTYDNILFFESDTVEYTSRYGVLDFRKMYGLSPEQAAAVSDHFPVWAEFSVHEGATGGSWAQNPDPHAWH